MIPAPARTLLSFLVPGAVVLLGAALLVHWAGLASPVVSDYYAWAALIAGIALAWRFQSSRALFATLILASAEKALFALTDAPASGALAGFNLIALLIPLNLFFFALIGECGLGWLALGSGTGIIGIQAAFVAVLSRTENAEFAAWAGRAWFPGEMFSWTRIPQLALIAFTVMLTTLAARMILKHKPVDTAYFWAGCAAVAALHVAGREGRVYLSTGVLIVAVAMIETGYRLAYHDELTALPARRAFNQAMLALADTYTIAIVDVDHFKKFNDTYGHDTGDQVLRMVAARLARVGGGGHAFRHGGEEFAILFNGASADEAAPHLEQLRKLIAESEFSVRGPDRSQRRRAERRYAAPGRKPIGKQRGMATLTVSIGVAESGGRLRLPEQVVTAADQALYRAKEAGRNRVEVVSARKARVLSMSAKQPVSKN